MGGIFKSECFLARELAEHFLVAWTKLFGYWMALLILCFGVNMNKWEGEDELKIRVSNRIHSSLRKE